MDRFFNQYAILKCRFHLVQYPANGLGLSNASASDEEGFLFYHLRAFKIAVVLVVVFLDTAMACF
jgi:hypothetical protein